MKKLFLITVIVALLSSISSYGEEDQSIEKKFLGLIETGEKLYDERKYEEAIAVLKDAKELKPDHYGTYLGIGLCSTRLNQMDAAKKEFYAALDRTKDEKKLAYIHANLGHIFHSQGDYENAIAHYEKAISYYPDYNEIRVRLAQAYNNLSNSFLRKGDYTFAEEMIKKAIDLNIKQNLNVYHHTYGNILSKQGKYNQAVNEYLTALSLGMQDPRLFYQLTLACMGKEDYQNALVYVSLAIQNRFRLYSYYFNINDDLTSVSYFKLGETYCSLGEYEKGIEAYQKSISIKEFSRDHYEVGKAYYKLKKYEKALEAFKNAAKIQDDFSKKNLDYIYYDIGRCYFELKNYNEALRYFDEVIKVDDRFSWAYEKKGEIYFLKGDQESSIRNFDRASELTPQNAKLHFRAGLFIYRNAHNADDCRLALIYLNKAYDLDSKNVDIIYLIAGSYYYLGENEKAKEFIKIGLFIQPDYEDLNKLNKKIQQKEEEKENKRSPIILNPPIEKTTKL